MIAKVRATIQQKTTSDTELRSETKIMASDSMEDAWMKMSLIAAACIAFASPTVAQSVGEKTGINALVGVSPTTQDFVKEAAVSDMFEVQSSELATQKSNDGPTKDFAQHMIQDHSKTTSDLKSFVSSGKIQAEIPAEMDSPHQSKLDKLKSLNGADFDKQYHSDQVAGHKDAVSLFERYAKGGENAELKAWAAKTFPTLQAHLKMAEDLNK
jgi:putative membrane protein